MQLAGARKALENARKEFDQLAASRNDFDLFPLRFISAVTMARRVGSILDGEVKGHRTPAFDSFWEAADQDTLHRYMVRIRNAELKEGETTIRVDFVWGLRPGRKGTRYRIGVNRRRIHLTRRRPLVPTRKQTWVFDTGEHEGEEVFKVIERYLSWLGDTVIPTAEQLLT